MMSKSVSSSNDVASGIRSDNKFQINDTFTSVEHGSLSISMQLFENLSLREYKNVFGS